MEEVGARVAPPIFIHGTLSGGFHSVVKKRSLPYHQQQQQLTSTENWNPKVWNWDSVRFVARPLEPDGLSLGPATSVQFQPQRKKDEETGAEDLRLKLVGGSGLSHEESLPKPSKRVRSGSPGSSYPMCQVDNCKEDLTNAKDYHRRHKVCEIHSKSSKALVGNQMQRFCQQCSRFHPLSEFDEGKRSCRRRLAGHNRRRRKTQPEDVSSPFFLPANHGSNSVSGNLDIVNLLTVLARAQGNGDAKAVNFSSVPNKDQLIQILSKINSLPLPADFAAKLGMPGSLNRNVPEQVASGHQNGFNGDASSPSTMDLLTVLSSTLAGSAPEALSILSQRSSHSNGDEKTKFGCLDQDIRLKGPTVDFPSAGGESSTSYQSPIENSDCQVQETQPNLPLQLFSSSPEDDSPPKLASAWKYFSSDSSNPMEQRSPSSSPPIVRKLFPMNASRESRMCEEMSRDGEVNANAEATRSHPCRTSLELFGGSNRGADNGSSQSIPFQAGYTSSSGSDQSPSSLNSDAQDRTGKIIFKLFDKDPSHLPGTLRTQIYNWLSHSPSEMESYIRPGCVVLSIYVSMSPAAWEELEKNLLQRVSSLVQDSDSDFWRSGRFLVHTGKQLASHKDGKIRLCKSLRTWTSAELISVSPLAVVGGQETSLLLRGRNLNTAGTEIHCTHLSSYISKQALIAAHKEAVCDEISLGGFKIPAAPSVLGRCFIEVENGFKCASFPVIIADVSVCQELRLLESEFDEGARVHDTISEDCVHDLGQPRSREEVLHFLNELGWLFQRKGFSSMLEGDYKLTRFKFLFVFSVERDCCALVKTLLDILLERNLGGDGLSSEYLEMLSEIQLLNRAVKRKCRNMVNFLIHYSIMSSNNSSKKYIFPPNLVGPGGVTPLHLAASTSSSDDVIDTLTSDPQEIGLRCWNSLLDENGLSPYAYALMRNNHSYNRLVARKLADRQNGQVSVQIGNESEQQWSIVDRDHRPRPQFKKGQRSCCKCSVVAARYNRRIPGSHGLIQRPYIHSMLAIAAVCVCVCLFLRGSPDIGLVAPFKWEKLGYGTI